MIAVWLVAAAILFVLGLTGSISIYRLARRQLKGPNSTAKMGERVVVVKNGEGLCPPLHTRIINLCKARLPC